MDRSAFALTGIGVTIVGIIIMASAANNTTTFSGEMASPGTYYFGLFTLAVGGMAIFVWTVATGVLLGLREHEQSAKPLAPKETA